MLSPDVAPRTFPGDVLAFGAPLDGPARDLNIMTRRDAWSAELTRLAIRSAEGVAAGADALVLLALDELRIATAAEETILSRLDAALLAPGEAASLSGIGAESAAYLIRLSTLG